MSPVRALARRTHHAAVDGLALVAERGEQRDPLPHPPILVVGPPRSGTTLLGQALVAGLDVGWFSGWHNVFAGAPGAVPTALLGAPATHFRSDHGRLASWREPHEAATWWYRFLPREPQAVGADAVDPAALRRLRRSMAAVLRRADRPVVWKNVVNSVRLEPILDAVPEAIIVEARRDGAATAASILRARASQAGGVEHWWSVRPQGWERVAGDAPESQVAAQIAGVRSALDRAREHHPATPWVAVGYDELVAHPHDVLDRVAETLEAVTGRARRRTPDLVPSAFGRPA